MTLRVRVDAERCVASGMCVFSAPEVFDQDERDGVVVVLRDDPADDQYDAVHAAIGNCPAQVISVDTP
ncbi:Ferredoxin-2 [Streptomyces sp. S4.7]|uniref:ferredoxin n=1 Tax=Streptomyces sp. S4.7 TaxID=2705439 RepID=UPI001397E0AC|nr:Ferredoxin-2 [Streptomyces sp. S4.7]